MTTVLHSFPVWLPRTQTWMYNQVRYLPPGIEPHVVCHRTENLYQFGVPNIHCRASTPLWRRLGEHGLRRLRLRRYNWFTVKVARAVGADILHSHFGNVGWADMPAARRVGVRHIVTFYGQDVTFLPRLNPAWRDRYAELFDHIDLVLCEGPHMAGEVVSLGCPEAKVRVQHLGIALEDIPFEPLEWRSGEPLRVLIAASFREKKGIPMALEALARLKNRVAIEVTIIGDAGSDPRAVPEKRKILDTIDRHGLGNTVRMLGYQPHARLLEEARRHHIFLSPSITAQDGDTEGGAPVSLIEMSAIGMMVVGSTHCDIPEVVIDNETGLLAQEGDLDDLVDRLGWAIDNPERWDAMRQAARRHIETRFDAHKQASKQAAIYRSLAG